MSFNGSGQFLLNSGGLPYVTGTTISSTHANNLNTDLATGLSTCITKDGQTTVTANLPMATFRHTNVGAATARTDYARASQVQDSALVNIGTIAGTNTITGSLSPAIAAYAAGQRYTFIPANTNTGATTININSVGARDIFWNGAACVGGELRQNIPAVLYDDGTQMHIVGNGFNAPFLDTHAVVEGSSDSTKKVRIEVDGLTTATTRVITMPDADVNLGSISGASMVFLVGKTASASASLTFTSSDFSFSAYDEYEFRISGIKAATDAQILQLQVSTDGGSSWITTNSYDDAGNIQNDAPAGASFGNTARSYLSLTGELGVGNAATISCNGTVRMYLPNSSTLHKYFDWKDVFVRTSGELNSITGAGRYLSATAINGVRFIFGSGNVASGTIRAFGIKNS